MALSATSYEILDDLLALRISNCTPTCPEEARDLKALRNAQIELSALQRGLAIKAPARAETAPSPRLKLSRRLQRIVHEASSVMAS